VTGAGEIVLVDLPDAVEADRAAKRQSPTGHPAKDWLNISTISSRANVV
jgi:hypothetical protein